MSVVGRTLTKDEWFGTFVHPAVGLLMGLSPEGLLSFGRSIGRRRLCRSVGRRRGRCSGRGLPARGRLCGSRLAWSARPRPPARPRGAPPVTARRSLTPEHRRACK
eukprot:scaffold674197_cov24-Prasinocladus_malaysianus.AAC.1